jgi:hypothetical protein
MNTPTKGKFRHIVFKDGDSWYAVALEFNIVESASSAKMAFEGLLGAVDGYIESIKTLKGARFAPLNQEPDTEYELLWQQLTAVHAEGVGKNQQKLPYEVSMFGTHLLGVEKFA